MLKQPALAFESSGVAGQRAVPADDLVAGDTIAMRFMPLALAMARTACGLPMRWACSQ